MSINDKVTTSENAARGAKTKPSQGLVENRRDYSAQKGVKTMNRQEATLKCAMFMHEHIPARFLELADPKLVVVGEKERFADYSPARKLGEMNGRVNKNRDPKVAGLYDATVDTVYIRVVKPNIVTHEFGHALDRALHGLNKLSSRYWYYSEYAFGQYFNESKQFISAYARDSVAEMFAECFRMYCGTFDSREKYGLPGREILRRRHTPIYNLFASIEDGSWLK